jgi:hypothetical protein
VQIRWNGEGGGMHRSYQGSLDSTNRILLNPVRNRGLSQGYTWNKSLHGQVAVSRHTHGRRLVLQACVLRMAGVCMLLAAALWGGLGTDTFCSRHTHYASISDGKIITGRG